MLGEWVEMVGGEIRVGKDGPQESVDGTHILPSATGSHYSVLGGRVT